MDYVLPVIFNTAGLAIDSESFFMKIRKEYIWWLTALTANPMKIRY